MRGIGRILKRGSIWWVAYSHRGTEYRESSHSGSESQAKKLLRKRITEVSGGKFIPNEDRLTFEEMVQYLTNDYQVNGRRSLSTVLYYIPHLRGFFGMDRAIDITPDRVKAYQIHRLDEKASRATANREVAILGRMLSLAVEAGRLSRKPRFQMLDGEKVRQGFVDHGSFLVLLSNLHQYLKQLVEFLYFSGWRKGEATNLEWPDVDLEGRTVRLRIESSKNKEPRVLPLTGRLWIIIQERLKDRRLDCRYVFHRNGRKIGDFKKSWKTACKNSGLGRMELQENGREKYVGIIPHDLRRCTARNLSRAGVPESVAMEITGHKTRSMYRRYRIVDERDLREATEKLQAHLEEQTKGPIVTPMKAVG